MSSTTVQSGGRMGSIEGRLAGTLLDGDHDLGWSTCQAGGENDRFK